VFNSHCASFLGPEQQTADSALIGLACLPNGIVTCHFPIAPITKLEETVELGPSDKEFDIEPDHFLHTPNLIVP
jgi:hypothetical protein